MQIFGTDITPQTPQTSSSRCVLIGDITAPRYDSNDLTPYVRERITETASFADPEALFYTLDSLTSRDFLFLGNIAYPSLDVNNIGQGLAFLGGLAAAYQHGVVIVCVYPDSADVRAMNELLNLALAEPEEDAPYKNFELLGAAVREIHGGNKHVFTYVATCDGNRDYFSSLISRDNTEAESADSSVAAVNTAPAVKASAEELYNELCELRVQKLFDWAEGLESRAKEMGASISGAVDKLIHDAALENELLSIAQGMTTDYDDDISMSFVDFYNKYIKDNDYSFAQELINRLGLKDSNTLDAYRGYSVKRNTNSHYQVISLHSFDTHKDYYFNIAQSITQPQDLAMTNVFVRPAVLGYTKALWPYLWLSIGGNHLERYLPDQTVNQSRSYTDSNGWTATIAISTTDSIESSASGEVGSEGAKVGGGVTAGHSVTYSYESTLSHTSETTWTAESDSDWITLSSRSKSGKARSSTIRYKVSENTTGKMREGTITITSGRDKVFIPFTQSAGRYINDK